MIIADEVYETSQGAQLLRGKCLTRDRGATGSSLTGITALCS